MKVLLLALVALAACGGAPMHTIQIVNRTNRPIEELYVYTTGGQRGTSRGTVAPNASTSISVKEGHVSVTAVSAKLQVDEHTRDKPTATQELELTSATELIFHDEGESVPGLNRQGTIGVSFIVPHPSPPPNQPDQAPQAP